MSTTQMYSGYDEQRPSSKVLCPPGGRTSNIFGTDAEPYSAPARRPAGGDAAPQDTGTTADRLFGDDSENQPIAPQKEEDSKPTSAPAGVNTQGGNRRNYGDVEETEEERRKREEEEKMKTACPARVKFPRGAYNPITGEDYPDQVQNWIYKRQQTSPSQEPAVRTRQPPGGRSSGPLW